MLIVSEIDSAHALSREGAMSQTDNQVKQEFMIRAKQYLQVEYSK
jgi:hypothetical protein